MKLDLHIHTKYSWDCRLEPYEIVKTAKHLGLDGIAILDHGTIKGGVETKKFEDKELKVITGSEVRTDKGEVIGYFLNEEIESTELFEVIDEIKAQDGIACIPHPFDSFRASRLTPYKEMARGIDAIEGFNSRCIMNRFNDKAIKFAKKYNLPITAGSDAHTAREIGNAGIIINPEDELRKSILKGEIFGKLSPPYLHVISTLAKIRK